jgi:transposase
MEGTAQGSSTKEHGARLSGAVELGRHVGAHPSCPLRRGARAGRTRSKPDDSDHRLPDCEGRSKRGASLDPSGYDAGKKIKGRKRHILVDTLGLLLNVVVHCAGVQDRDGAFHLLRRARRLFPFIKCIFADGGYAGQKMALVVWRTGAWTLQIVKRSDAAGFEVLPKRWIVERTFAWISRNRRLARDFERYAATVVASASP